ncbi:MAG: hypothetical protein HKO63_04685 [Acidimicrobiia bacterium]|nr:hypothetical protein [Acidimicrobiia bacterium]MBT8192424.1 hypothetical protein [Acidimicrobiia bacterium]NNL13886.1 hypothetical protein [Acidimicrobiia bacterium]NNL97482.1 hypothetical protein [Acidimicrobiia bacterium]
MDRKLQRQIDNHRESEARWLQKMLFASAKAREARLRLAEAASEDLNPLIVLDNGTTVPLDTLEEIIRIRVEFLMMALGRRVHGPLG